MRGKVPDHIARIKQYIPGTPEEDVPAAAGQDKPLKLASNENPLGPSPRALEAAWTALKRCHRYPDGSGRLLREALSTHWGLSMEQIVLGNGSTELVEILARTFLGKDDWAVMAQQSFIMYRIAVMAVHGHFREIPLREMRHDLVAMASACDERTALLYIANPNNPTGTYVSNTALDEYFRQVLPSVLTVLDEAYGEYLQSDDYPLGLEYLRKGRRVVVLRTFSKAYGLAGLRLGYALASAEVASAMERVRSPFNTNRVAQAAALAALGDEEHLRRSREMNRNGLAYLEEQFLQRGLRFTPSAANFILVHFDRSAQEVYQSLLELGVITRPMTPYGFPQSLRITVGGDAENARLVGALDKVRPRNFLIS